MANNKIVDRESLKAFRQANDTRYKNGSVVVGKSLTTKKLEPISDEVGSTQTNPFLFQGTGTDDNTTRTPTAPVVKHLELRGNTVKWNQLVQNGNFETTSNWRVQSSSSNTPISVLNNVGTVVFSGNGNSDQLVQDLPADKLINGHKYLSIIQVKQSVSVSGLKLYGGFSTYHAESIASTDWQTLAFISNENTYEYWILRNNTSEANLTIEVKNAMLLDLTNIYGAGNEPTTYLQFVRDYPLSYYEYNAGELKSCSSSKLITTGRNQFDVNNIVKPSSSTDTYIFSDFIKVIGNSSYTIELDSSADIPDGIYLNEYDGNGNEIIIGDGNNDNHIYKTSFVSNGYKWNIQLQPNTRYIKYKIYYSTAQSISAWSNVLDKVCIYLTWDGSKTGFVPYVKHEYDLPSEELRSAGSVYDTITPNGVHTQNIDYVDLSSLTWYWQSQDSRWYSLGLQQTAKIVTNDNNKANMIAEKYEVKPLTGTGGSVESGSGLSLSATGTLFLYTNDSVNSPSGKLYYEIATPIVSEVNAFAENIEVDDFGTMEFIPSDSTEEIIVPQGNRFFYPADYVLFIDDLYEHSKDGGETSSANNFVTQSELTTAISQIPTGDFGFPIIQAPSSNVLTDEQIAQIRSKGAVIVGNISNWGSWQKYILFPCGEEYSGRYFGYCVLTRNGFSHIEQYSINPTDKTIATYGSKYIDLDSGDNLSLNGLNKINGKNIPAYPSSTGTFVLKCVNGTLTWVVE